MLTKDEKRINMASFHGAVENKTLYEHFYYISH